MWSGRQGNSVMEHTEAASEGLFKHFLRCLVRWGPVSDGNSVMLHSPSMYLYCTWYQAGSALLLPRRTNSAFDESLHLHGGMWLLSRTNILNRGVLQRLKLMHKISKASSQHSQHQCEQYWSHIVIAKPLLHPPARSWILKSLPCKFFAKQFC